jgi:DNA modification methylase
VQLYIEHTMEWLREAKTVLRKDGVAWIDLGDSRGGGSAKSLALIPQRLAIACQDEGWIVRSYIIIPSWMPESAKDRPTDSYRVALMLLRSQRYWYDGHAVRVASKPGSLERNEYRYSTDGSKWKDRDDQTRLVAGLHRPGRDVNEYVHPDGLRNLGDIWDDIPPAAYPDAHFATFSVREPEICIKASCPAEICVKCGKPRVRINKKGLTAGWTDCGCNAGWESGVCLDPFIGTGTSAIAARMLGRRCIGIDASEDYLKQAVRRLTVGDKGVRAIVAARREGARQETLW